MKPVIVILAVCALGYVGNHWQEIQDQRTLFFKPEPPALIIYGSKADPASVRLEGALIKKGISFQKRELTKEAYTRELTDKLARVGKVGAQINMPVAEIDGMLIQSASVEQIVKRLK